MIPRGSQAVGRLIEVSAAGKTAGAKVSLVLTSVTVGGLRIQIETEALAMEAKSDTGRDAGRIIGGTAIGAIIGGIAGGGDGAGIGAIVGGGAGTAAAVLTRGRELEFEAEQEFHFTLAEPVNVRRWVKLRGRGKAAAWSSTPHREVLNRRETNDHARPLHEHRWRKDPDSVT